MIEKGKKVKFHYTLKVGPEVLASSHPGNALEYVHGKDSIIPGLQKGLEGHEEGEKCTIEVKPEEGYGAIDPRAFIEVPKDQVPAEAMQLGASLSAEKDGETIRGRIQDIRPETVVIDFNHPLAGKILTFDVEILSVHMDL